MYVIDYQDFNEDFEGDPEFLKNSKGETEKCSTKENAHDIMMKDVAFYINSNSSLGEYSTKIGSDQVSVEFTDHGHGCKWKIREII